LLIEFVLWPGLVVARATAKDAGALVCADEFVDGGSWYRLRVVGGEVLAKVLQPQPLSTCDELLEEWLLTVEANVERQGLDLGVAECPACDSGS
jgi:hypothetical protein